MKPRLSAFLLGVAAFAAAALVLRRMAVAEPVEVRPPDLIPYEHGL